MRLLSPLDAEAWRRDITVGGVRNLVKQGRLCYLRTLESHRRARGSWLHERGDKELAAKAARDEALSPRICLPARPVGEETRMGAYMCRANQHEDLTDAVSRARGQDAKWRVKVTCSQGHENIFSSLDSAEPDPIVRFRSDQDDVAAMEPPDTE